MTKLNKKQEAILESYNSSCYNELWQVYGSYSHEKARAFKEIKNDMERMNGYGLRILSYCIYHYTCAFKYRDINGEHLRYYTKSTTQDFIINDALKSDSIVDAIIKNGELDYEAFEKWYEGIDASLKERVKIVI